jgi:hypothetical protein
MLRSLKLCTTLLAVIAFSVVAASPAAAATARFGPFASGSTDSGTCGNEWALDKFQRVYTVSNTTPTNGTYRVREDFINGSFVTLVGSSPGACESGANNGGTVLPGITGRMGGFFSIIVSGGTYNGGAACNEVTCGTTAGFVSTVFGPNATYDIPIFFFGYVTSCNGAWINASANLGGNHGDITGAPHPCGTGGDGD